MSLFKAYSTDEHKENAGVIIRSGIKNENGTEAVFIVAYNGKGNKQYLKTLNRLLKPVKRQHDLGVLGEAESEEIMLNVFVESVLKGWEHVYNEAGELLEFTKENAIWLMRRLPKLYDMLQKESAEISLFRSESLEEDAKN